MHFKPQKILLVSSTSPSCPFSVPAASSSPLAIDSKQAHGPLPHQSDSFKYQLSTVPCSLSVPSSPTFVYPTACSTAPRGCPLGGRNLRTEPDFLIFPQTCFSDILVNGNSLLHVTQARTLPSLSFLHPVSPLSSTFRLCLHCDHSHPHENSPYCTWQRAATFTP